MAVLVVDLLETVEIDHGQGQPTQAVLPTRGEREPVLQQPPVGETGELIGQRRDPHLGLGSGAIDQCGCQ